MDTVYTMGVLQGLATCHITLDWDDVGCMGVERVG